MTGEEIRVPNNAYSEAEQAARDVTQSNVDEYVLAGMHVGVRWGGIAELSTVLADIETHHGAEDPVAVKVRERIAELVERRSLPEHFSFQGEALEEMRAGWTAARATSDYPLAELLRELVMAFGGGLGYSWGVLDAARVVAKEAARKVTGEAVT